MCSRPLAACGACAARDDAGLFDAVSGDKETAGTSCKPLLAPVVHSTGDPTRAG